MRIGRNRWITLGQVSAFTPEEAREKCQKVLDDIAHGRHLLCGLYGLDGPTLGQFVEGTYTQWARANRSRTATNTLEKLQRHFVSWFSEPLSSMTLERIEWWKQRRLNAGRKPTTLLRDLFALSSVLSRAVSIGLPPENPVRRIDKPRIDRTANIRFLDPAEESSPATTLDTILRYLIQSLTCAPSHHLVPIRGDKCANIVPIGIVSQSALDTTPRLR